MQQSKERRELSRSSARGGVITMAATAVKVAVQLLSTVVLARLLTPDDYGVLGMVTSFTVFASLFKDLGLSSAAIQVKDLTRAQQTNLFWINTGFALLLTVVVAAAAPALAAFYGRAELTGMTLILSTTFLLTGLSAQHNVMLVRAMRFGPQAIANIAGALFNFGTAMTLALTGWGVWALAWGLVAGAVTRTGLIWYLSPFMPGRWQRHAGTRKLLGFGANVTVFNFANYFSRNLDSILIGKFVSSEALGYYSRANQLLMFPISNLRAPIEAVCYPALSKLQDDRKAWEEYYLNVVRLLACLSMPIAAWLIVTADSFVPLVLGAQWNGSVPLIRILSIVCFIQPSASLMGTALLSQGRSRAFLVQGLAVSLVVSAGFGLGTVWGATGVAWSYVVTSYLVLVPTLINTYRGTSLKVGDFFRSVAFPALVSAGVAGCLALLKQDQELGTSPVDFALLSFAFLAGIALCLFLFPQGRELVRQGRQLTRSLYSSKRK